MRKDAPFPGDPRTITCRLFKLTWPLIRETLAARCLISRVMLLGLILRLSVVPEAQMAFLFQYRVMSPRMSSLSYVRVAE